MTVEPDTRGIDALTGEPGDSVLLPALIWEQMMAELGDLPPRPHIEPFADEPWRQLPTMQELERLWSQSTTLDQQIFQLAHRIHGETGEDLMKFLAQQRQLAELELAWTREAELSERADAFDGGRPVPDEPDAAAAALGGGEGVPGEPENSDPVDEGGQAEGHQDSRRPPKVSRRGGPRKTERGHLT